jgi:hypothetical protein
MHHSLDNHMIALVLLSEMNIKVKVLLDVCFNELRLLTDKR